MIEEGRRERKKRRTRAAIIAAASALFAERGFEQVTVTEIAEHADVARATFFSHFPSKESIVLDLVGDDDPAAIVSARAPGTSALDALRAYYGGLARAGGVDRAGEATLAGGDGLDLVAWARVITESPILQAGVSRLLEAQRTALAEVLRDEFPAGDAEIRSDLAAAQICAAISALKSKFFGRLAAGTPFEEAALRLPGEVELAFHLLEHGIGRYQPDEERRAS